MPAPEPPESSEELPSPSADGDAASPHADGEEDVQGTCPALILKLQLPMLAAANKATATQGQ
jgi:hypothetical protein